MEPISMTFTYEEKEYVRAVREYLKATGAVSRLSIVFVPLIFLFSMFYLFYSDFSLFGIVFAVISLLALVLGMIVYGFVPVWTYRRTEKLHEPYTLLFSDEEIHFQTPSIDSHLQWDVYSGYLESGDFLYLTQANRAYTVLPKRALDAGALERLRGMIREKIGENKK